MIKYESPNQKAYRQLRQDRAAMFGLFCVVAFVLIGVFAPILAPFEPDKINLSESLQSVSSEHLLGTDQLGRDILSRIIYGTRFSLSVGVIAVSIASVIGIPLGLIAGYVGGILDTIVVLFLDVLLAFPTILLALVMVSILGPNLQNAMIAVGLASMPIFAKLARGSALSIKQNEYVLAAIGIGQSLSKIILRHIFPNSTAPLIVQATLRIGTAILTASSLSFLGMGAQPPTPEWGALVSEGRALLQVAPHVAFFPGLAIMICILGFSVLGDGLNDAFNPRITTSKRA